MATLDDKLLGEKQHYYCSSSSDEESGEDEGNNGDEQISQAVEPASGPDVNEWSGYSTNTGPKGVIEDFQRWKQLEAQKRSRDERRNVELAKKMSLSCQTTQEHEEQKLREEEIDEEMENLLDNSDPALQEFMKKRMEEMIQRSESRVIFGHLIRCKDGSEFLREIEQDVRVICHIYSMKLKECHRLNGCFEELAQRHLQTKFVSIEVGMCGMSVRFEEKGCPAILIYKKGSLIGSFLTVTNNFGSRFDSQDVEGFLVDHGFLSDSKCVPELISQPSLLRDSAQDQDSDSE